MPKPYARFEDVPPGHFLSLVRKFDWPPSYTPQPWRESDSISMSQKATKARERSGRDAIGWGNGTIRGLTPKADAMANLFEATKARAR